MWACAAYPSLKSLAAWISDLEMRVSFFRRWASGALPSAFLLPAFFFPQGFLTAALQRHARRYHLAIDTLSFDFEVQRQDVGEDVKNAPEDGVLVQGLWVEAARWDRRAKPKPLLKTSLHGEIRVPMPLILFLPWSQATATAAADDAEGRAGRAGVSGGELAETCVYECPLYKTSARHGTVSTTGQSSNFILSVTLPATGQSHMWVLQGTCMLCQTDD